jgi:putative MATE family efflux protein
MDADPMRGLVLRYSLPTIAGMLINSLYGIVDRFWVGRIEGIGSAALAGVGLSLPISNIIMAFSMLVGIGAAANISIQMGRQNARAAEEIVANGLSVILIIAVLFTTLGVLFTPQLLTAAGATESLMPYALPYTRLIIGGCIFNMTAFAMNHPIRATGNPRRFAMTQMVGGVSNIILDPIFIFALNMGIAGAAIATILSQMIAAVLVFSYYASPETALRLRWANLRPRWKTVAAIFSIGLSPFLLQAANSFLTVIANFSLARYGTEALGEGGDIAAIGAMTIISSLSMLFCMPVVGINQGSQPIIGFNFGRQNAARVKSAYRWAVFYAMIITTIGFVLVETCAELLVSVFNNEEALIRVGAPGLRIFLSMLALLGFQIPSSNFFQAIGRAKIAIVLSLLRQVIILAPAYFLLPLAFGLTGVWMAGPFSDLISAIITLVFILREFKILDRQFIKEAEDFDPNNAER